MSELLSVLVRRRGSSSAESPLLWLKCSHWCFPWGHYTPTMLVSSASRWGAADGRRPYRPGLWWQGSLGVLRALACLPFSSKPSIEGDHREKWRQGRKGAHEQVTGYTGCQEYIFFPYLRSREWAGARGRKDHLSTRRVVGRDWVGADAPSPRANKLQPLVPIPTPPSLEQTTQRKASFQYIHGNIHLHVPKTCCPRVMACVELRHRRKIR